MARTGRAGGAPLVVCMVVTALLVGCGGDGPSDAELTRRLAADLQLGPGEADCLWGELEAALSRDEIVALVDDGILSLPVARWGAYVHAALACTLHDDLVDTGD